MALSLVCGLGGGTQEFTRLCAQKGGSEINPLPKKVETMYPASKHREGMGLWPLQLHQACLDSFTAGSQYSTSAERVPIQPF